MRKVAAVLLALIFAGSAGGVGCFAARAALAAAATMACCTPDCPAPDASRQPQSCSSQLCAPSVEVAPVSHGAVHPQVWSGWAAVMLAPTGAQVALAVVAAGTPRYESPPMPDQSVVLAQLCSRQI